MSDPDQPMAGALTLTLGAITLLALFWMLRTHEIPLEAWALVFTVWICGTAITLREKGGGR